MRQLREMIAGPLRSLAVRSLVLGILWWLGKASLGLGLAAPFWLFLLVAFYLFLFPVFRQKRMLLPFGFFVVFSIVFPAGFWGATALAALFFLIMGIKDLLFVDRERAYSELAIILFFLFALCAYASAPNWSGPVSVWMPLLAGFSYALAAKPLPWKDVAEKNDVAPLVGGFLVGEIAWAVLFLPMDWIYQAAILFMFMVLMADLQVKFRSGALSARYVLSAFLPFAVLTGAVLMLNSWGI